MTKGPHMKVKLTRAYACAPEGHTTLTYPMGAVLEGAAASLALADGAGIEIGMTAPPENKVVVPDGFKAATKPRKKKV